MHLDGCGFSRLDFYGLVIRQDVLFGVLASYFGYGVFAHTKLDVDFAVLIRLEFLLIGVAHEVGTGDFEGAALDLVIVGCLYHLQGAGLRFVEEAHASFGFDPHNGPVFRDGEGVIIFVALEKFRAFLLMQEIASPHEILHLIEPRLGFGHFAHQLIDLRVEFPVVVHIGVNLKDSPGQLVFREVGVHLGGFGNALDDLVFDTDFNGLPVLGDLHREGFFRQYEGRRRRDFPHQPISNRYLVKFKVPDLIAFGNHECGFLGEFGFVETEQADFSACQFKAILIHLPAGYFAAL